MRSGPQANHPFSLSAQCPCCGVAYRNPGSSAGAGSWDSLGTGSSLCHWVSRTWRCSCFVVVTTSQEPPGSPRPECCFRPSVAPARTLPCLPAAPWDLLLLHHQVPEELPPPHAGFLPRPVVPAALLPSSCSWWRPSIRWPVSGSCSQTRGVSGQPPCSTEACHAPALGSCFCLRSTDACSSSLLSFPPARMARYTASMLGSTGTSAASSTTTASPTWCLCACSCHTRTCGFPGLPSSAPA